MRLVMLAIAGLVAVGPVLAGCDETPPAATLKEIPKVFVGKWDGSVAECRSGGPLSVTITPTEMTFPNSHAEVTGVAPDEKMAGRAVRVEGKFSSGEANWDGAARLELSEDGTELSVVNGTTVSPRIRCPK